MSTLWDNRYAQTEYVYGTEPNHFFREQLSHLQSGRLLLPGEGEGRNAVFAAGLGWDVTAFDSSSVAREKAGKLAAKHGVSFDFKSMTYDEAEFEEESFDAIALIFAHTPDRRKIHRKILRFLSPGGTLILEGFSKKQLNYNSGGPNNHDLLFSEEELSNDFQHLPVQKIWEEIITLEEGLFHNGAASVIRVIGKK